MISTQQTVFTETYYKNSDRSENQSEFSFELGPVFREINIINFHFYSKFRLFHFPVSFIFYCMK